MPAEVGIQSKQQLSKDKGGRENKCELNVTNKKQKNAIR